MSISYRKLDIALSADKETVLVFGQELSTKYFTEIVVTTMLNSTGSDMANSNRILNDIHAAGLDAGDLKWSTKTGHRVRVFPVSIFRFVWG
ncbi:DUF6971 family protein [Shigella flexneri]|uniref:DUF6971 family protein n=2 Tax=Enterobacteriaceae TaxID=543 RepID=UPI003CC7FC18